MSFGALFSISLLFRVVCVASFPNPILLTRLTDAIKQAISGTLTYTTPAVMSEKQKGNFVYQSTFKYAKHKQWEGHLKKHKLNDDGTLGTIKWDAADMLNKKKYTSRNLWTIGLDTISTSNFTTDNRDALKELLFPGTSTPTDTEADNLINFIRGIDTYDEDNDVFIEPKPFPSWSLNATQDWEAPTEYPDDGRDYVWNESTKAWDAV